MRAYDESSSPDADGRPHSSNTASISSFTTTFTPLTPPTSTTADPTTSRASDSNDGASPIVRTSCQPTQVRPSPEGAVDPSTVLPDELLFRCTVFLDASSLVKLRSVSRALRRLSSSNEAGWEGLCQLLWREKVHVGRAALEETSNRLRAYQLSLADARRNFVFPEELVFDPARHSSTIEGRAADSATVWSFRFKESAGDIWTASDPWYQGQPCRKLVFLPDGTVRQYEPLTPSSSSDATPQYALTDPPLPMAWRFLQRRPMDLPPRPFGSYLRMSVAGRDVPTYSVKRCSTNWGFTMESCWGVYASFELPPRRTSEQPHGRRRRLRRTEDGGSRWVVVPGDSSSDDAEYTSSSDSSSDAERNGPTFRELQDDSTLTMTNDIQWREAFLYNAGARVLPEGDEATQEFDRAWGGLRQTS